MKLYDASRAPNPRRLRIFLAEKQIEVPRVEIDIGAEGARTPDFLRINPLGQLPVLELDDGSRIADSLAICRYFEASQPEPVLFGTTPEEIGRTEQWNRHAELELFIPVSLTFRHGNPRVAHRFTQVPGVADHMREHALKTLNWFDRELSGRAYLAGDRFSIADITALVAIDFGKVAGIRLGPSWPSLVRWHGEVSARPSVAAAGT
jgi:glutathione S-transferase